MPAKGYRATHCKRGHAIEGDNIAWYKGRNGQQMRTCRRCIRENARRKRGSSITGPAKQVAEAQRKDLQRRTGKKQCSRCRKRKPLSAFKRHTKTWDGLFTACRECEAQRWSSLEPQAQAQRKMRMSARNRDRTFGLAPGQYDAMFKAQGGKCAICGNGCRSGRALAVDHDHDTGAVRALLCSGCNTALGLMHHEVARMRAAARYLERHGS